jgi:hypothetical protein
MSAILPSEERGALWTSSSAAADACHGTATQRLPPPSCGGRRTERRRRRGRRGSWAARAGWTRSLLRGCAPGSPRKRFTGGAQAFLASRAAAPATAITTPGPTRADRWRSTAGGMVVWRCVADSVMEGSSGTVAWRADCGVGWRTGEHAGSWRVEGRDRDGLSLGGM